MESLDYINSTTLIMGAIGILVVIGVLVASNRLRAVTTVLARGVAGGVAIWGINALFGFFSLDIAAPGLNLLTVGSVALFGLPGMAMVYGLNFFM